MGIRDDDSKYIASACISEALGTFFLTFLYLTQTEKKTLLSKDQAVTTLILAASYLGSIIMVSAPQRNFAVLNPAIGSATAITMTFFGDILGIKTIYIYVLFPFAGSISAVIFFELIYKKVKAALEDAGESNTVVRNADGDDDLLMDRSDEIEGQRKSLKGNYQNKDLMDYPTDYVSNN